MLDIHDAVLMLVGAAVVGVHLLTHYKTEEITTWLDDIEKAASNAHMTANTISNRIDGLQSDLSTAIAKLPRSRTTKAPAAVEVMPGGRMPQVGGDEVTVPSAMNPLADTLPGDTNGGEA